MDLCACGLREFDGNKVHKILPFEGDHYGVVICHDFDDEGLSGPTTGDIRGMDKSYNLVTPKHQIHHNHPTCTE